LSFIDTEIKNKLSIASQGSKLLQSTVNHNFSNNTVKFISIWLYGTHGRRWL